MCPQGLKDLIVKACPEVELHQLSTLTASYDLIVHLPDETIILGEVWTDLVQPGWLVSLQLRTSLQDRKKTVSNSQSHAAERRDPGIPARSKAHVTRSESKDNYSSEDSESGSSTGATSPWERIKPYGVESPSLSSQGPWRYDPSDYQKWRNNEELRYQETSRQGEKDCKPSTNRKEKRSSGKEKMKGAAKQAQTWAWVSRVAPSGSSIEYPSQRDSLG